MGVIVKSKIESKFSKTTKTKEMKAKIINGFKVLSDQEINKRRSNAWSCII
jgi:hypothetical protein